MSNKKKHSDTSSLLDRVVFAEDEQSYNDYIGDGGEAHHPPPSAKKPRLGSETDKVAENAPDAPSSTDNKAAEEEPVEPKSIDVFSSQPKTAEGEEDYSTCPEEFEAENSQKSTENPEKSTENPETTIQNEGAEEIVADSQNTSHNSSTKENSTLLRQKTESFSDDGSEEIGEKFDSIISGGIEEEEEEEEKLKISVKMNDSKNSDSSDDRMMETMKEEREMMNRPEGKTSRSPSPILFSETDGSGQHSSDFQDKEESPIKERREEEEPMEVDGAERRASVDGNKTMEVQEEEDDVDAVFGGGPDQNLEQEEDDEEELNPYERQLHQGVNNAVRQEDGKKESTSGEDIQRISLTSKPTRPLAEPMDDDGGIPDDVFDDIVRRERPRVPINRRIDKQCTTDLAFLKVEQFEKRELQFQPDFNAADFDPMMHYRYCEIPGLPKPDDYTFNWFMIDQDQWRPRDKKNNVNECYIRKRQILERYLRENRYAEERRDGGYLMFVYVIQEMWYDPKTSYGRREEFLSLPALFNYFKSVSRQKGYLFVANQFANLVRIALNAEHVLPKNIYQFEGAVSSATLSHEQCAALVARMFFSAKSCSFKRILKNEFPIAVEKLHFLFAYFDKIAEHCPQGCVSFRLIQSGGDTFKEQWAARREAPPTDVRIYTHMYIEETALCTQVDFANAHLGGGVLDRGAVQEEIRFLMCPEMFVGMLLANKPMDDTQAISIVGARVYSSYEGYANTLKWKPLRESPHHARQNDPNLRDKYGRLRVETIAIDATQFERNDMEEQLNRLTREMKKATIGFTAQNGDFDQIPIVSGFWGCGAFNGHKPLKFVQQVIAAGVANRPLVFCTFGEEAMSRQCEKFMARIRDENMSIGRLNQMLRTVIPFINHPPYSNRLHHPTFLFDFCHEYMDNPERLDAEKGRLVALKERAASSSSSISSFSYRRYGY